MLFLYHLYINTDHDDHDSIEDNIKLSNEIQSRLIVLENGLKRNRLILEDVRVRIDQLSSISRLSSVSGAIGSPKSSAYCPAKKCK